MSNETNRIPSCQARPQGRHTALPYLSLSQVLWDNHNVPRDERLCHYGQHVAETSTQWSLDDMVQALEEALMITSDSFLAVSPSLPTRQ
jgi:hypothetical protein